MTKSFLRLSAGFLAAVLLFTACSDDDASDGGGQYVLLTAIEKFDAGYITSFKDLPSGTVSSVSSQSKSVSASFGFRAYKNWLFTRTSSTGAAGLQRYSIATDGSIQEDGFIANAAQFLIIDDTHGYYQDEIRGTMKLQLFNPTTMQRTGELDFADLRNQEIAEYQAIGKHILAAKEGKLYASITYGTTQGQGYGDDQIDHIELAVINIADNNLDKVITYDGVNSIGWGSSANKMWTLGDDGSLYIYSPGLAGDFSKSAVIRIKQGATEVDKDWIVHVTDYDVNSSIAIGLVRNGKLYIELPSTSLQNDFSNFEALVFDYYAIDIATGEATKITGMPQHHYVWANEQAITEIDGRIYFWVHNHDEGVEGYYTLDDNGASATQAFNIDHDGFTWGFVKLQN
ncbi:hypothetical protein KK062_24670 [Fulvivirgaceae bacterium PWU5]|uniref:DUF4374 domain-containing protein n=1 Tax=Dawidia cretensis TaxID=2782350 RepID=A0AAP2E2D8_9BACT|nr:DUF4374 domain-containing protein [Dawidia cretensis]MBT1711460.1 hypothetical protein [Dawidia cretensis]